jgi:hypothetical protein
MGIAIIIIYIIIHLLCAYFGLKLLNADWCRTFGKNWSNGDFIGWLLPALATAPIFFFIALSVWYEGKPKKPNSWGKRECTIFKCKKKEETWES